MLATTMPHGVTHVTRGQSVKKKKMLLSFKPYTIELSKNVHVLVNIINICFKASKWLHYMRVVQLNLLLVLLFMC